MEIARKISFILVLAVILLHSAIPHAHHNEMNNFEHSTSHNTANNFWDFLVLGFHNDLGSDDGYIVLENQTVIDLVEFTSHDFRNFITILLNYYPETKTDIISDFVFNFYKSYTNTQSGLRAPPSI